GSYTDKDYIAYLMEPVAHGNLREFLDDERPEGIHEPKRMSLRNYFGCLSGAIHYLHHTCKLRHRDLTCQNILVKGDSVYISDFGTAYDHSKGRSTTQDRNIPRTEFYMAPEVAKRQKRNSASDMWSLGVVFLEMATVLLGSTVS
ncbi:kinase-like protein, partial [Mytilinidion resinicola]